jgi:hypothetical protein
MKRTTSLIAAMTFLLFANLTNAQYKSLNYSVLAAARVQKSPPQITLNWVADPIALTYDIYRKDKGATTWGTAIKTGQAGTVNTYSDLTVVAGKEYEYQIIKRGASGFIGIGYIACGIELAPVHNRGSILLLVESSISDSLTSELNDLSRDLAGDGWRVQRRYVHKDSSVKFVSTIIVDVAKWSYGSLKAIYILGHVPVPYSGNYGLDGFYTVPPDGHPDHAGAWPADVFYATDPLYWTDNETNTGGSREANKNYPKDGKYDQIELPDEAYYKIGRVDLSNMPTFSKSESQLLKQYIRKAHDYRYGITKTLDKGLIDENFDASIGAFASTAWRNFSSFFGPENIRDRVENGGVDYFTLLKDSNYVFAFGAGAGSYNSCSGIGISSDFNTKRGAIFNLLFGSYFGDWDNANNFLRAPLAASENGLTSAWSGRPWWHCHPMGMGETIGYSTLLTQNNKTTYSYNIFRSGVPIALMGDPSLRLYMMQPAANLSGTAGSGKTSANLSWTASAEPGVSGYYVYRSSTEFGTYTLINPLPVTGTSLTDNSPYTGTTWYQVRAAKMLTTPSGSFWNLSQGVFTSVSGLQGQSASVVEKVVPKIEVYPNPNNGTFEIIFENGLFSNNDMTVIDLKGRTIWSDIVTQGGNSVFIQLPETAPGIYVLRVGGVSRKLVVE